MKKSLIILTFTILLSLMIVSVYAEIYYGSKNSNVYHFANCSYVDRINSSNLITFNSPEDAIAEDYHACSVCNPPTASTIPEFSSLTLMIVLFTVTGVIIVSKKNTKI